MEGTPTPSATTHLETIAQRAQAVAAAREQLEAALIAARRDGVALRRIAEAAGLSHEHVRQLTADEGGSR